LALHQVFEICGFAGGFDRADDLGVAPPRHDSYAHLDSVIRRVFDSLLASQADSHKFGIKRLTLERVQQIASLIELLRPAKEAESVIHRRGGLARGRRLIIRRALIPRRSALWAVWASTRRWVGGVARSGPQISIDLIIQAFLVGKDQQNAKENESYGEDSQIPKGKPSPKGACPHQSGLRST
jgi:hypothetical protein